MRAFRERIFQSICLEIGGFLLAAPLFALLFDMDLASSSLLILAMTMVEVIWSALHNLTFDRIEARFTSRRASDRPVVLRMVHAITHEVSSMVVTLPVIMVVGGHGLLAAVMIDISFAAFYAAYIFVFYLFYDRLRPVRERVTV